MIFYAPFCFAHNYDDAINSKKSGDYVQAERIFLSLLKQDSKNSELWFELGLVQRFQGKTQEAISSQQKAFQISPKNNDIKLEIARLKFAEQKYDEAQKVARDILRDNPNYSEAQELSTNIAKIKSPPLDYNKWQLDFGGEVSRFSRVEQNDWRENFMQVGFRPQKSTLAHVRFDDARRFNENNKHYEIGVDHVINKNYNFGFDAGYTPNSIFLPKLRLKARGGVRVVRDNKYIGDTWILANAQKDRYQAFDILILKYGVDYFLTQNLDLKFLLINVIDQNDRKTDGWASRLDWQTPLPKLRLYGGLSSAPETQNAIIVDTKSKFFGGAFEINKNLVLNLSYTRDDRKDSFIRKVVATSLSVRF